MRGEQLARRGPWGSFRVGKIKKVVKRRGVGVLVLRLEIFSPGHCRAAKEIDLSCGLEPFFLGGGLRCRVAGQVQGRWSIG
jgi:hypothetical protein